MSWQRTAVLLTCLILLAIVTIFAPENSEPFEKIVIGIVAALGGNMAPRIPLPKEKKNEGH